MTPTRVKLSMPLCGFASLREISFLFLFLCLCPLQAEDAPVHRWQFTAEHVKERTCKPLTGELPATIVGPVQFGAEQPKALLLDGNIKAKHRIDVTNDPAKAKLPSQAITVEAWVRIDRIQEWGGIVGALQDNGAYEKGWLLGYQHSRFFFAVAGKGKNNLTYLLARTSFQTGYWYHVAGVYDGKEQRLYVDGKLQATSSEQSGDIAYPPKFFLTLAAYRDDDELYPMQGGLEQVSIHGAAFGAEKVKKLFEERKNRFPDIDEVRPEVVDWPTWNRDNQRSGITQDELKLPLHLQWVHQPRRPPEPAWPEEAKADYYHNKYQIEERVTFDRAFHVIGAGERVYFSSSAEDSVTCLDAVTGATRWTFTAEAPVRLAPTLTDGKLLFGSDDGHVYCLSARDGTLQWRTRIGPSSRQIAGNGRIVSAWPIRTDVLVEDGKAQACAGIFAGQGVFQATLDLADGKLLEKKPLETTAQGYLERRSGQLFVSTGRNPAGAFVAKLKRLGKEAGKEVNTLTKDYPFAFIGAGGVRIAGGDGKLAAFRTMDGTKLWEAKVEGRVFSLAVVRGRLLAGTDRGLIYCFGSDAAEAKVHKPAMPQTIDYADAATRERYQKTAAQVVKEADQARGYCLVLGSGEGRLAVELALRTEWRIIGVEPDAEKAQRSRRLVHATGLAGSVAIHQGPLDSLPYSDYLFNVIVHDTLAEGKACPSPLAAVQRVLRPCGGLVFFGKDVLRRGPLEGAGDWTHMYADPSNTSCSNDKLVAGAMQIQWFGSPGPRPMIDRHHRTSAPVTKHGRLFIPGEDRLFGVDAYNGTVLWDVTIPDSRRVASFRDASHLALADEALYVAAAGRALALAPATGKTLKEYAIPNDLREKKYDWGYVARVDDLLIGSAVKPGSIRRQQNHIQTVTETHWDFVAGVGSDALFAYKVGSDKPLWTYRSESGVIVNQSLAIGKGRLYFLESKDPATLAKPIARSKLGEVFAKGATVAALELSTGKVLWRKSADALAPLHHNIFISYAKEHLVIVGSRNNGADKKKSTLLYDVHVFDAASGEKKWSQTQDQKHSINGEHGEQERHPVIVGDKLFCEPYAYDLATGKPVNWDWPWASAKSLRRGCGTLSASASCFFFRNETVTLFDLEAGKPQRLTAETRPGCWINLLPAGGLLLAPEASSGCTCNHSVQTSLALIPVTR